MKTLNTTLKLALAVSGVAISLMMTGCGSSKSSSPSANTGVYGPNANGYYGGIYANFSEAGYLGDNFAWNNVRVTDAANFKNFVKKVHGVCDQAHSSGGIYSCDAWANAYFRVIYQASSTTNQGRIMFMTYPQTNYGSWYGYQLPSWDQFFMGLMGFPIPQAYGATRNPIALDMQSISLINNSKGFEARTYGAMDTLANKSLIQFMVREGKVLDNTMTYELYFEGKSVATGTLYRCTYPDCR
ncbi:MAG: hypothetical protein ACK5V3_05485 [Bdellovibrionales bacterium]